MNTTRTFTFHDVKNTLVATLHVAASEETFTSSDERPPLEFAICEVLADYNVIDRNNFSCFDGDKLSCSADTLD